MRPHHARAALLGMGLALGFQNAGPAQVVVPQGPGAQPDVNNLAHQMGERIRHLGEDIGSDLGQTPQGRHLLQDVQELAQTIEEFHESLHDLPDPFQRRQAYTGIQQTWQHLKNQFAQPGFSTPAVDRASRRVDDLDAQIQQALGMRGYALAVPPPPPQPDRAPPPWDGFVRAQRVSYTLVQRAEYLAATIQAEATNLPDGDRFVRRADQLTQTCNTYYDSLQQDQDQATIQQAFLAVTAIADQLESELQAVRCPPRVERGWESFAATEILVLTQLGLPTPPPVGRVVLRPVEGGPSPVVAMADQLFVQVNEFVEVFGPTSRQVPEGQLILADALRLQAATAGFRQGVAQGGPIDPNRMADEFREVDACWQRLARRVNRIARGRIGPNIQQVQAIGATSEQIHTILGMPGYPPTLIGAPESHNDRHRD